MRLKSIILSELGVEQLKATQRIEEAMNSNDGIDVKCEIIKSQLRQLATLSEMINTWRIITLSEEQNKEN